VRIKLAIVGVAWVACFAACSGDTQHSSANGGAPGTAGTTGTANAGKGGQSSGGSSSHAGAATVGPNTPLDDFPQVYSDSICQLLTRCYSAVTTALSPDCSTFFERLFREQNFPAIATAVAEGRVQYHPEAVAACLDEVATGSCDIALLEFCPRVFVGSKTTGEACTLDLECVDQQCAVNGACPGACAPYAKLGAACTNENRCEPELTCQYDADGNTCASTAKLGETCSEAVRCRGYTTCSGLDTAVEGDTGVCANRADLYTTKLDEPCDFAYGPFCEPSLVCTMRFEDGVSLGRCGPRVPSGSACALSSPDACPKTEYCRITSAAGVKPATGTCTPNPGLGEECRSDTYGIAPCPDDQFCNLDTKLCALSKHLDEACTIDDECYSNHCSAAGKCVTQLECEKSAEP